MTFLKRALILFVALSALLPTASGARPNAVVQVLTSNAQTLYDEQLMMSLGHDFPALSVNVTAIEQCASDGLGPAYLLNGLSEKGYWFQVGLSWNWPSVYRYSNGTIQVIPTQGFNAAFEIWTPTGDQAFEPTFKPISVNQGDSVLLDLHFYKNQAIFMHVFDWNTRAVADVEFSAHNSSYFVGTSGSATNSKGFFSGLMTEQYHLGPYFGNEQRVLYSYPSLNVSSSWMGIDEWVPSSGQVIFNQTTNVNYASQPDAFYLSGNGATENSTSVGFLTGGLTSGATCAPPLSFWSAYRYPIIGIIVVALSGVGVFLERWRRKRRAQAEQSLKEWKSWTESRSTIVFQ